MEALCPAGVRPECWAQLNDRERAALIHHIGEVWYERVGKSYTDEQWLQILVSPTVGLKDDSGK